MADLQERSRVKELADDENRGRKIDKNRRHQKIGAGLFKYDTDAGEDFENMSDMGAGRKRHSRSRANMTGKKFREDSAGRQRGRSNSASGHKSRSRSPNPINIMDDNISSYSRTTKKHYNSKITKINNSILVKGHYTPNHLVRENVHTEHA